MESMFSGSLPFQGSWRSKAWPGIIGVVVASRHRVRCLFRMKAVPPVFWLLEQAVERMWTRLWNWVCSLLTVSLLRWVSCKARIPIHLSRRSWFICCHLCLVPGAPPPLIFREATVMDALMVFLFLEGPSLVFTGVGWDSGGVVLWGWLSLSKTEGVGLAGWCCGVVCIRLRHTLGGWLPLCSPAPSSRGSSVARTCLSPVRGRLELLLLFITVGWFIEVNCGVIVVNGLLAYNC